VSVEHGAGRGERRKAKGKRQKAKGKRQKAKGERLDKKMIIIRIE
jgi:hypothetical protein